MSGTIIFPSYGMGGGGGGEGGTEGYNFIGWTWSGGVGAVLISFWCEESGKKTCDYYCKIQVLVFFHKTNNSFFILGMYLFCTHHAMWRKKYRLIKKR